VGVEIVLDKDDRCGSSKVDVGQVLQDVRVVDGGAAVGDLDVAPAFDRREHHERVGDPIARVFVIDAGRRPGIAWAIMTTGELFRSEIQTASA
jgi:hypothetical protein